MGHVRKIERENSLKFLKKERRMTDEEKNSGGLVGPDDDYSV